MFSPVEIDELLSEWRADFTIRELREYVDAQRFEGFEDLLKNFFTVVGGFNERDKALFVKFVTASPRLPPGGLAGLMPSLTVKPRIGEEDVGDHTLPTVMTCKSYVKLPPYSSITIMRKRFLTALHDGQNWFGFA
jgi:E3 ubiquitin-protein ligase TRIP12